jgi:hypothetical protein
MSSSCRDGIAGVSNWIDAESRRDYPIQNLDRKVQKLELSKSARQRFIPARAGLASGQSGQWS